MIFILPVHAARVGVFQPSTPWNNINHNNIINTGVGQDRRNSAQIEQFIGNRQTNLIYSIKNHNTGLSNELNTIFQRVFTAPIVSQAQRAINPLLQQTEGLLLHHSKLSIRKPS